MADSEKYLIKVTGFESGTKESVFSAFFSNPGFSGVTYGKIKNLIVEETVAYILFEHAEDAAAVINHSPYTWKHGAEIHCTYANRNAESEISKPSPAPRKPVTPASTESVKSPPRVSSSGGASRPDQSELRRPVSLTSNTNVSPSKASTTKVVVTGFDKIHKQTIELYFQLPEFRPADTECIDMGLYEMGYIIITYKTEAAAEVLLNHDNLKIEESNLTAQLFSNMPMYVELTGFAATTHTQTLQLFLKQQDLGGDQIENINLDDLDIGYVVVKYASFDAAQKLLKTKPLKLIESVLQARLLQQSDIECRQVLVEGFKKTAHPQTMDLYLRSIDRPQIESIDMDAIKEGRVIVKFKTQKGAEDFSRKPLDLEGQTLQTKLMTRRDILQPKHAQGARPKELSTKKKTKKKSHHTDDEEEVDRSSDDPDTEELSKIVVIEGLPQGIHKQDIELTIDTPQMGGDCIDGWNFDWLKDYCMATITYKTTRAAQILLKKKTINVSGVEVKLYSAADLDGYHRQLSLTTKAVKAVYKEDIIKVHVVELYFKNKKKGGGKIDNLFHDSKNKTLYIIFEDKAVAQSIGRTKNHVVDGCQLNVSTMKAAPPTHKVKPPFEEKYVLVLFLPREVTTEELQDFLDAHNDDRPKCFFSTNQGVALAKFKHEPEFQMLLEKCQEIPFKGRMINIQKVPKVRYLQVLGIEGIGEQELGLFLDSKSHEKVSEVNIHKKPKLHAVVEFENSEVVQEVLHQQPFNYNGKTLSAELYFKGCGLINAKVSESSPWIPNDVPVQGINVEVLQFVNIRSKLKRSIESPMKEVNAQVVWPLRKETDVVLKYVENNSIPIDGWRKCATDTFCAEMQQLTSKTVQVLEMAWEDVQKKAKLLLNINTENEVVRVDSRSYLIIVTGLRDTVIKTVEKIQGIVNEIEAEIERLKQVIREDMAIQKPYEIELLKEIPKFQAMLQNGEVKIDIASDNKKISLEGLPNDIKKTKLAIYEIIKEIESQSIPFKKEKLQFFQRREIKEHLSKIFKSHGHLVKLDFTNGQAVLYGVNRNTIDAVIVAMKETVKNESIKVPDEQKDVPLSEKWNRFVTSNYAENMYVMIVCEGHGCIRVIATKDQIGHVVQHIKDFLKENALTEQTKSVSYGEYRLIVNHHKDKLNDIKENINNTAYHLITKDSMFIIKGPIDVVKKVSQMLDDMIRSVHKNEHTVESPGMPEYFNSEEGGLILDGLESKHKVCIGVKGGHAPQGQSSTVSRWKALVGGVNVAVVKGDLTKCKYDVLVNAANEHLKHYATLAKAFVDAGGHSIQAECDEHTKKHGDLKVSQNAVTRGGRLACKNIVHAVGPRYNKTHNHDRDKKAEGFLYDTIKNVLITSHKTLHASTIGLPIISTGVFGFPFELAVEITLNAIQKYTDTHKGVFQEIALVHDGNHNIDAMIKIVKRMVGGESVSRVTHTPSRHSGNPRSSPRTSAVSGDTSGSESRTLTAQNGLVVDLKLGELAKEKADVLVSAGSPDLKLDKGNLTKSLLREAGSKLQDECDKAAPKGGVNPGDLVVTGGANLQCEKVYHGACLKWDGEGGKSKKVLSEYIKKCLQTADKAGFQSMAIPSIGTGALRMPNAAVAKLTLSEIMSFKPTALKHINIVIYPKDKDSERAFASEMSHLSGDRKRTMAPKGRNYSHGSGDNSMTTGSGIIISVKKGELAHERSDVVVISVTDDCKMKNGALSRSVLKVGGNRIQEELDKAASGFKLDAGKVLVTKSGNLKCKFLYHGTCLKHDGPGNRSEKALAKFVLNCLEMALRYNVRSITFPALGTGGYRIPHDTVAQIMFEEVKRIRDAKSLKYVNFVIYPEDERSYNAFKAMLTDGGGDDEYYEGSGETDYEMVEENEAEGDNDRPSSSGGNSVFTGADMRGDTLAMTTSGNLVIEVEEGSLTEVNADAIVNGTYGGRLLGGVVGKALGQAGGYTLKEDCESKEKFKKSLVVTTGGNMPCRHVLHIDVSRNTRGSTGWRDTVLTCLTEAEKNRWSSIAFPALGTGKSGQSPETMAAVFMDAFKQFINSGDNKNLELIKLVVFDAKCFQTMQKEMQSKAREGDGAMARIAGAVGGALGAVGGAISNVMASITGGKADQLPRAKPQGNSGANRGQGRGRSHPVTLEFHSFSNSAISQVISEIERTCKSKTITEVMESQEDQEYIENLTGPQIEIINGLGRQYKVNIKLDKGRVKKITIYGWQTDVYRVKEAIKDIFRDVDEAKMADVIQKQVKWQYLEGDKFKDYPPEINKLIEAGYNDKKKNVTWKEQERGADIKYVIDFDRKVEIIADSKKETKVQRFKPGESVGLPTTWSAMPPNESCVSVPLDPKSQEYAEAIKLFNQQTGSAYTIVKVQRIQNPSLYQKVKTHENFMKCTNPKSRLLFHGTGVGPIAMINANGFNRAYSGAGASQGRGVYFAPNATTSASDGYSKPDASGLKYMYVCTVLTGDFTKGQSGWVDCPPKNPAQPHVLYDSVVNDVNNPVEFVVFSDTQAYPDYLITFKR